MNLHRAPKTTSPKEKLMLIKKITLSVAGANLAAIALLTAQPLRAQSAADGARIETLEHAVEFHSGPR
jgi:hypothetical protein